MLVRTTQHMFDIHLALRTQVRVLLHTCHTYEPACFHVFWRRNSLGLCVPFSVSTAFLSHHPFVSSSSLLSCGPIPPSAAAMSDEDFKRTLQLLRGPPNATAIQDYRPPPSLKTLLPLKINQKLWITEPFGTWWPAVTEDGDAAYVHHSFIAPH